MDAVQLEPLANLLVDGYLETAGYSRQFLDDYGIPPNQQAKVQHMRSVVHARATQDPRFTVDPHYVEYGRIQLGHLGDEYLLRSTSMVKIERAKAQQALFDGSAYLTCEVLLLVYRFHASGLDLSLAGTRREPHRSRLEASGEPTFVGTWYFTGEPSESFEQGEENPFPDLGEMDDFGDGEAGAEE